MEKEALLRAYVQDLRTFANCLDLLNAFKTTFIDDLYPLMKDCCPDVAEKAYKDFYELFPDNQEEKYVDNAIRFADIYMNILLNMFPIPMMRFHNVKNT